MTPWLDDGDVRIYHGDALERLREMPSESVQCIVTSPPFWGLRDYSCEGQIGLEETPDEWCARLVTVMREARRVLRSDGVCWIEVGDTYMANASGGMQGSTLSKGGRQTAHSRRANIATPSGGIPRNADSSPRQPHADGTGCDCNASAPPDGVASRLKHKDLVGAPWLLAFALRADGWFLRSDTIWARPNPMPESVTDRPTKAHSYLFLLSKQPRYYFDSDAIREESTGDQNPRNGNGPRERTEHVRAFDNRVTSSSRNARSVQTWPTEPTPFAHFATYPQALVSWCIRAGTSEHGCCSECGAPWRRVTERTYLSTTVTPEDPDESLRHSTGRARNVTRMGNGVDVATTGWESSCHCVVELEDLALDGADPFLAPPGVRPCVVLDPFMGSGTTALVARRLGRHALGVELNAEYLAIAAKRLEQLSLLTGDAS